MARSLTNKLKKLTTHKLFVAAGLAISVSGCSSISPEMNTKAMQFLIGGANDQYLGVTMPCDPTDRLVVAYNPLTSPHMASAACINGEEIVRSIEVRCPKEDRVQARTGIITKFSNYGTKIVVMSCRREFSNPPELDKLYYVGDGPGGTKIWVPTLTP